jgi:hypothetical protein
MSIPEYNPFTIRLTRETKDASKDDVIKITPCLVKTVDEPARLEYKVTFSAASCMTATRTPHVMSVNLSGRFLETYLRSLLRLVENDSEPYHSVQFDMPLMPSVLINPREVSDIRYAILSYVGVLVKSWPVRPTSVRLPTTTSRHLFFDEDGNTTHETLRYY